MSKSTKMDTMDTMDTTNPATGSAIKARPFICTAEEVRGILGGTTTTTRLLRPVKVPKARATNDGKPCGLMLYDLSRAWVDHGFPTDESGEVLPAERWSGGTDPAPESAYREHYLHVPVAHPVDGWERNPSDDRLKRVHCPHGELGEHLWIKETWRPLVLCHGIHKHMNQRGIQYRAGGVRWADDRRRSKFLERVTFASRATGRETEDDYDAEAETPWRSSVHMPRWAARIFLEITDVRVQRLQEMSEADARAEGFPIPGTQPCIINGEPGEVTFFDPRTAFAYGWNAINSKRPGCAWIDNPWTWAITFKRLKP
jgi:hypothetical protein